MTDLYSPEELVDRQVLGVTIYPPKQIGPMRSEVLVTGFYREDGAVVLEIPERAVPKIMSINDNSSWAAENQRKALRRSTMYIATNRFQVALGRERVFEELWRERESYLDTVPGFRDFHLLRGPSSEESTLFVSHSTWESSEAFVAWTESESFRKAHSQARSPKGTLLGHPQFEGFEVVL